ncbi:MAG: hypothetical protein CHACPFDD_01654 [Phycisphaerae bacterium]|nr:hypothetical protein [Phycisphaerae bacterium]
MCQRWCAVSIALSLSLLCSPIATSQSSDEILWCRPGLPAVTCVAFSPDGSTIAAAGRGTIHIWSTAPGYPRIASLFPQTGSTEVIAFSRDGSHLAAGSNFRGANVNVYRTSHWTQESRFQASGSVYELAFTSDGQTLATSGRGYSDVDRQVRLWALDGAPLGRLNGHGHEIDALDHSPVAPLLATLCHDGLLRLWDTSSHALLDSAAASGEDVRFSPDGRFLAIARIDGVEIWATDELARLRKLGERRFDTLAYSPDGALLVAGDYLGSLVGMEATSGRVLWEATAHDGRVSSVAVSPNGGVAVTGGGGDASVHVWRLTDGARLATLIDGQLNGAPSVSPRSDLFATPMQLGEHSHGVGLRRVSDGELVGVLSGHEQGVDAIGFSTQLPILASAAWRDVRLWSLTDLSNYLTISSPVHRFRVLAFSPDGVTLATANTDTRIQMWSVLDGSLVRSFPRSTHGFTDLAFSRDGDEILSADDGDNVRIWDSFTGQQRYAVPGRAPLAVAPDGECFAAGSVYGGVELRRTADGGVVRALPGFETVSVDFSSDGRLLLAAGSLGTVVWRIRDGAAVAKFDQQTLFTLGAEFDREDRAIVLTRTDATILAIRNRFITGDVNCDGTRNAYDIDPFVLAISDPTDYEARFPDCPLSNADANDDGSVDAFDVDAFIAALTGGA